jgi:hypothetical protein
MTSSWIDEVEKPAHMRKHDFWKKLAMKDLAEIQEADLVILDTLDVNCRGGREVEYGFVLGAFQNKSVYIVGPIRNVFHTLCDKRFDSWEDCLHFMQFELPTDLTVGEDTLNPQTTVKDDETIKKPEPPKGRLVKEKLLGWPYTDAPEAGLVGADSRQRKAW